MTVTCLIGDNIGRVYFRESVQIETSPLNLYKVRRLLEAIRSGEVDGVAVRPPLGIKAIAETLGVAKQTFYRWIASEERQSMPQPVHLTAIASKLLKISEQELEDYFNDRLELQQLFTIRPRISSLQEVYGAYESLPEPDKDLILALLLRDRAVATGNALQERRSKVLSAALIDVPVFDKEGKSRKGASQRKLSAETDSSESYKNMSQSGDALTELERRRLSKLLQQGVASTGYRTIREAAIGLGFNPGEVQELLNILKAAYFGEGGWRIHPDAWVIIAALCPQLVEVNPWTGDDEPNYTPGGTYRGDVAGLKRVLVCCEVCRNKRLKRDKGVQP